MIREKLENSQHLDLLMGNEKLFREFVSPLAHNSPNLSVQPSKFDTKYLTQTNSPIRRKEKLETKQPPRLLP